MDEKAKQDQGEDVQAHVKSHGLYEDDQSTGEHELKSHGLKSHGRNDEEDDVEAHIKSHGFHDDEEPSDEHGWRRN